MTKRAWIAKSLLIGTVLGLVAFAIGYGFLTIHQELGLSPGFSVKPAILVFLAGVIASGIYLNFKTSKSKM
jgi:hypothetical protein